MGTSRNICLSMSFYFGFLHESKKHDLSLMNSNTFINKTVSFENQASEAILFYSISTKTNIAWIWQLINPCLGFNSKQTTIENAPAPLLEKELKKVKKQLEVQVTNRPLLLENKIENSRKTTTWISSYQPVLPAWAPSTTWWTRSYQGGRSRLGPPEDNSKFKLQLKKNKTIFFIKK